MFLNRWNETTCMLVTCRMSGFILVYMKLFTLVFINGRDVRSWVARNSNILAWKFVKEMGVPEQDDYEIEDLEKWVASTYPEATLTYRPVDTEVYERERRVYVSVFSNHISGSLYIHVTETEEEGFEWISRKAYWAFNERHPDDDTHTDTLSHWFNAPRHDNVVRMLRDTTQGIYVIQLKDVD